VKRRCFDKGIVPMVLLLFLFCGLTFAQGKGVVKMQGMVDKVYVDKKMMIINEEFTFIWDQNTTFGNEKGSPITVDKFKRNAWVYIEGVGSKKGKPILIQKIYLIPREIREGEKHLYPFIQ
jgi:hypothetical protein